ncbi:cyclophilin-like fold protein [Streptomyces sp. NPDC003444]
MRARSSTSPCPWTGSPRATGPWTSAAPSRSSSSPDLLPLPAARAARCRTLDGRPVAATLNDSPAARDFARLLPLTLDLEDFHGTERVADLPRKPTTDGAPAPVAAKAGDLAYYAPWGNLALFYEDGPAPSVDLLVLGHLDVGADRLGGATRITLEAAP